MSYLVLLHKQFNAWTDKEEWQTCKKVQTNAEMTETDSRWLNTHGNIIFEFDLNACTNGSHAKGSDSISSDHHSKVLQCCWDASDRRGSFTDISSHYQIC